MPPLMSATETSVARISAGPVLGMISLEGPVEATDGVDVDVELEDELLDELGVVVLVDDV